MRLIKLSLLVSLLSACTETAMLLPQQQIQVAHLQDLKGQVYFPAVFQTQTLAESVRSRASVSLLYPYNHPDKAFQTAAAGSTDTEGKFSLRFPTDFTPISNEWFVLEASRRVEGQASFRQSLRTWVRWTGSRWQSLSSPNMILSAESTALSALINWGMHDPTNLLGSLDTQSYPIVYNAPTNGPTLAEMTATTHMTQRLLSEQLDPVASLAQADGEPLPQQIKNPQPELITATRYCPHCDLQGLDLSGQNLNLGDYHESDFRGADLRHTTLLDANLEGARLEGALLTGATWSNGQICEDDSIGSCAFDQRANQFTNSMQQHNRIAAGANGDYILVWDSDSQDGDRAGIYARRYSAAGIPLEAEFLVNSDYTSGDQVYPDIAIAPDGRFLIVWQSPSHDTPGDGLDIYARWYLADGQADGSAFKVSENSTGDQYTPKVDFDGQGRAVIAWVGHGKINVFARRFNAQQQAIEGDLSINQVSRGGLSTCDLAVNSEGRFVVSWNDRGTDGQQDVFTRVFDANALPVSDELRVNQHLEHSQTESAIGIDNSGRFVVTWTSFFQDEANYDSLAGGMGRGIYARRYDATGVPLSNEFRVNTVTLSEQTSSYLAMRSDGHFAISWISWGHHDYLSGSDVYLQQFNPQGAPLGPETLIAKANLSLGQSNPALAASDKHLIVAWEGFNYPGGVLNDVYHKIFGWRP